MPSKLILKIIVLLIIVISIFFLIEAFFGEVVIAKEDEEKGRDEMFPFYWLTFIVGGLIASTLSYVSWRKYKGEKQEKNKVDNDL